MSRLRHDRTGVGAQFGAECVRIGFERQHGAVRADDFVFVDRAFVEFRDEEFPDARRAAGAHRIDAAIPVVEVADDADAARARRPYGKIDAAHSGDGFQVRAEFFVGVVVAAFAHEVQIKFAEKVREGVRVVLFEGLAGVKLIADAVVRGLRPIAIVFREGGLEETFVAAFSRFDGADAGHLDARGDRVRVEKSDHPATSRRRLGGLWTQQRKGVSISSAEESINLCFDLSFRTALPRNRTFSVLFRHDSTLPRPYKLRYWRKLDAHLRPFDSRGLSGNFPKNSSSVCDARDVPVNPLQG